MKNVFGKKIFVPFMAVLLCFAVAFGTAAVASQRSADINIYVNADDTVKKYTGSDEDAIYLGEGINEWDLAFGPDSVYSNKMSDAYFEITAQRLIKIKPKMVRLMIIPYYLCYMEEADAGEARWNAAETGFENADLNFNSAYMYNFWRYLEVFQAAGTAVELNYGYSAPMPMGEWFTIKDVPMSSIHKNNFGYAPRSLPRNLKAFANNLAALLKECEARGFIGTTRGESTIQYVNFYNEMWQGNEGNAWGDTRVYWTSMLRHVHEALVDAGYRSDDAINDRTKHRIIVMGIESNVGDTFEATGKLVNYIDYLYENAYLKGYCDMFDTHQYLIWLRHGTTISRGIYGKDVISFAHDRWKMNIKGSINFCIAEHGTDENNTTYIAPADNKDKFSGFAHPFDGTNVSQAMGYSLGGAMSTLTWFGHSSRYPRDPNFSNNGCLNLWLIPSCKDSKTSETSGIENVNSTYGDNSIFMRYLPDNSRVAKSFVDDANKDGVRLATYFNGADTSIVAEFDYVGGMDTSGVTKSFNYDDYMADRDGYNTRSVKVHLGDIDNGSTNKKFYKYVYEYCESSFISSKESWNKYDGNAIMPDGKEVEVVNGVINDTISANHCLVIYSTIPPTEQIALADGSREITLDLANTTQVTEGVQIKIDTAACVRIPNAAEFEFDVYRGVLDGYDVDKNEAAIAEGRSEDVDEGYPNYLDTLDLKKAYFKTDCSEYKNSPKNGTTLNKRMGTVEINSDRTSATYKCATDEAGNVIAKAGDTIAVRVKIKGDPKLLGTQLADKSRDNVLQIYDTDVYAVAIIKIVDSTPSN